MFKVSENDHESHIPLFWNQIWEGSSVFLDKHSVIIIQISNRYFMTQYIGLMMFIVSLICIWRYIIVFSIFWFIPFQEEQNKKSYKSGNEQKSSS